MEEIQSLKREIFNLCEKIYCPAGAKLGQLKLEDNIETIISFVKRNRLVHYLALECAQKFQQEEGIKAKFEELILEYNDYQEKLKKAIACVQKTLDKKHFIIIKTFSSFPHLTHDLDILVKGEDSSGKVTQASDLLIDINTKVSWGGAEAISEDFVWRNTQRFTFAGLDFFIPAPILDTLIRIAHIPFELAQIRLGELLHIYKQVPLFDWQLLENEAKLMGWPKTFKGMTAILESLHLRLFQRPLFEKNKVPISSNTSIDFPFRLPLGVLAAGVIEKRAWRKILGARFILKDRILHG